MHKGPAISDFSCNALDRSGILGYSLSRDNPPSTPQSAVHNLTYADGIMQKFYFHNVDTFLVSFSSPFSSLQSFFFSSAVWL